MKKKILLTLLVMILICSFVLAGCSSEDESSKIIEFGEYPQTIKAADVTITETLEEGKRYLGSDGAYYAKVKAHPYTEGLKFSDGTVVEDGESYYFKYEPIKWRVLSKNEDGTALILSEKILDGQDFYADDYKWVNSVYYTKNGGRVNRYSYSTIRTFLNEDFYKTAFKSESDIARIQNQSSISKDKVFLLSQSDVTNVNYGFAESKNTNDPARVKVMTDYSRAMWVMEVSTAEDSYGVGMWWLSSEYVVDKAVADTVRNILGSYNSESDADKVVCVNKNGSCEKETAVFTEGVVPAMRIMLP